MERYLLQKQNSVTKQWANYVVRPADFDTVEKEFHARTSHEDCTKYKEKWRMIEISVIHAN